MQITLIIWDKKPVKKKKIQILSSGSTERNKTNIGRDGLFVVYFQRWVWQPRPHFKMATVNNNGEFHLLLRIDSVIRQNQLKF